MSISVGGRFDHPIFRRIALEREDPRLQRGHARTVGHARRAEARRHDRVRGTWATGIPCCSTAPTATPQATTCSLPRCFSTSPRTRTRQRRLSPRVPSRASTTSDPVRQGRRCTVAHLWRGRRLRRTPPTSRALPTPHQERGPRGSHRRVALRPVITFALTGTKADRAPRDGRPRPAPRNGVSEPWSTGPARRSSRASRDLRTPGRAPALHSSACT